MIFKGVHEGRPYPEFTLSARDWAQIPPRQIRLDQLNTITTVLALDKLLSEDSTFYGDLFAHVIQYRGELYLEDGLHRAVRSALRNRTVIHARLLDLDELIATGAFDPAAADPVADPPAGPAVNPSGPSPAPFSSGPLPIHHTDQLPPVPPRPVNPRRAGRSARHSAD